jgi:hypothetical protein
MPSHSSDSSFFMPIRHILFGLTLGLTYCGHEVLYKFSPSSSDFKANEIAIVQFDSRPLGSYWNASARWNLAYCRKHGHQYVYITKRQSNCFYASFDLSPAWCKVNAMIKANEILPEAKAFLYLDSDALMTVNYSLVDVIGFIRRDLKWDVRQRPLAFNQDGPGWACKFTMQHAYPYCLNSGTVFWTRSDLSLSILQHWWNSAGDPYNRGKFPRTLKWRTKWPWEQAQMYPTYERYKENIMRLSFPNASFLPWMSTKNPKSQYPTDFVEPWCFSHWPGANCFITHFCASLRQKLKMMETYQVRDASVTVNPIYID